MRTTPPQRLLACIRGHWSVKNNLHWCLDISFADDQRRVRQGHGTENFARLSRIALNLLKALAKYQVAIKAQHLYCSWGHDYLLRVVTRADRGH